MKDKMVLDKEKVKLPKAEQFNIYRTTPYQFIYTAPLSNNIQTVGKHITITDQIAVIKPVSISTKID